MHLIFYVTNKESQVFPVLENETMWKDT